MTNSKFYKYGFWILVVAIAIIFFLQNCTGFGEKGIITVTPPKKSGVLQDTTNAPIDHEPILVQDPVKIPYAVHDTLKVVDSIDVKILREYLGAANDTIKQLNTLIGAIKFRKFSKTLEDDNILITATGTVRGELKNIILKYEDKPKPLQVPIKQTWLRVLAGAEVGGNLQMDKPVLKANLDFQLKSGDIIGTGVDNTGNYYLRYSKSFLNFKK